VLHLWHSTGVGREVCIAAQYFLDLTLVRLNYDRTEPKFDAPRQNSDATMRLLKCSSDDVFELVTVDDDDPPPYAILSHCWITKNKTESQEVTYDELIAGARKDKLGYDKIRFCSRRAAADGLEYSWIDTCCINKATIDELTAAINSMFRWYQRAAKCYVYLDDVSVPAKTTDIETSCAWVDAFRCSRWFTRGWTLQELVAPAGVEFFSKEERWLGNRTTLEAEVHAITKLPVQVLRGQNLAEISMKERMSWAAERNTTLQEDKVYCLLGIFGVFLPLIYGEGEVNARLRLIEEYQKRQQGRGVDRLHDLCGMYMSQQIRSRDYGYAKLMTFSILTIAFSTEPILCWAGGST
jgi:hypothetical protein